MATIKDVAKLAGVGVGTASRAISGKGSVSADALARVQAAVAQLQFTPSSTARALSLGQSGMVGVFVPVFEGSFYSPILDRIDRELRAAGRHLMVASGCGPGDEAERALQSLQFLFDKQCDGVLALSSHATDAQFLALHRQHPGRLVVINRDIPEMGAQSFGADHELAGRLAARALLQRGHRAIAALQGAQPGADVAQRLHGFNDELARHGLAVAPQHQLWGGFDFASGRAAALQLMQGRPRPDISALFCANDVMAMAAIQAFAQAGLRVPQDVSVIGYDDTDLAAFTTPALTSVHLPILEMTTQACRQMLNQCYGMGLPVRRVSAPHLVWRDSVGDGPAAPIAFPPDALPTA